MRRWLAIVRDVRGSTFVDDSVHSSTLDAKKACERYTSPAVRHVATIVVETVDLQRIDPPETPDEELQRVERVMLNATARWLELTGRAEPPLPKREHEQMRDVIEAMRPIVDAALAHRDAPNCRGEVDGCYYNQYAALLVHGERCEEGQAEKALFRACDNNRERLSNAMSAWGNSQTLSEAERMRPVVDAARQPVAGPQGSRGRSAS